MWYAILLWGGRSGRTLSLAFLRRFNGTRLGNVMSEHTNQFTENLRHPHKTYITTRTNAFYLHFILFYLIELSFVDFFIQVTATPLFFIDQ